VIASAKAGTADRPRPRILSNPALNVYDNEGSFLMCVYNRERALCHRLDVDAAPRLDRCRPSCANIARTDRHAAQLAQHAQALEKQGASEAVPARSPSVSPDAPPCYGRWPTTTSTTASVPLWTAS
jgi:hypothetical protein